MRVVHDGSDTLATDVEVADSILAKGRGLALRPTFPEGSAMVFPFRRPAKRAIHMAFVRFPLDVLWLANDRVEASKRLRPWTGYGRARADTIVELPAGMADAVQVGDVVRVENGDR